MSPRSLVVFGFSSLCLTLPSITYSEATCLWLLTNEDHVNYVLIVHMVPIEVLPGTRVSIVPMSGLYHSDATGLDNGQLKKKKMVYLPDIYAYSSSTQGLTQLLLSVF